MRTLSKEALQALRERYPKGTRVELVQMDDPYNRKLVPGCKGTVLAVDSIGTLHCEFDNGRCLGVVPGEDSFRKLTQAELAEEQNGITEENEVPTMGLSM